jgi:hypothetical protein
MGAIPNRGGFRSVRSATAGPAAVANGYVVSVNMLVGAYTLAATQPTFGARHVTLVRTVVVEADTPGTVVFVGTDTFGKVITETLIVGATGVTVTGVLFFATITSITGVGWVNGGTADTIVMGWDAINAVAVKSGAGILHAILMEVAPTGTLTFNDTAGAKMILPAAFPIGLYPLDIGFAGKIEIVLTAGDRIVAIYD